MREDGEQRAEILCWLSSWGGLLQCALAPLERGGGGSDTAEDSLIECDVTEMTQSSRERGNRGTTPLSGLPACFSHFCFSAHIFLPSLRDFGNIDLPSRPVSFLLSVPFFPEDLRHSVCFTFLHVELCSPASLQNVHCGSDSEKALFMSRTEECKSVNTRTQIPFH